MSTGKSTKNCGDSGSCGPGDEEFMAKGIGSAGEDDRDAGGAGELIGRVRESVEVGMTWEEDGENLFVGEKRAR